MPMAVAGMFIATAAFAQVEKKDNPEKQNEPAITDTIPDQETQTDTFPTDTEPYEQPKNKEERQPMVTEPEKKDKQMQKKETTPAKSPKTDTTEEKDINDDTGF